MAAAAATTRRRWQPISSSCADLFDQTRVRTYSIDIDPAEWQSLDAEFHDLASLATGLAFAAYHPIVFHLDDETVTNAMIKLHGQSSWMQTVMLDGDRAKMQFDVAFDKIDPAGKFHGVDKLVFDMPRSDWTFLHDRLAHAWLRQSGIMAPLRGQRAPGDQRQLLRPLRRRGGRRPPRDQAVLPRQRRAAICGRAARSPETNKTTRRLGAHGRVLDRDGSGGACRRSSTCRDR